jgi:hypothetical protein
MSRATQDCLLSGGFLELGDNAVSGYCAPDPSPDAFVPAPPAPPAFITVTMSQVSLQFKLPYKLADVTACIQARISKAISDCTGLNASQVNLTYTKSLTRSLASVRSYTNQEMASSKTGKSHLTQSTAETVICDLTIFYLESDAAAQSIASKLTQTEINVRLARLDIADVILTMPARVSSISSVVRNVSNSPSAVPTSKSAGSSDGGCFPSRSTVITIGGVVKRMDELRVGDDVLTSRGFRKVLHFGHADPTASEIAWSVRTDTGMSVLATAIHDIILRDGRSVTDVASLVPGDLIWSLSNGSQAQLVASTVTAVSRSVEKGVFSPHTETYDIVVDGVLMSCGTSDWRGVPALATQALLWAGSLLPSSLTIGTPTSRTVRCCHGVVM